MGIELRQGLCLRVGLLWSLESGGLEPYDWLLSRCWGMNDVNPIGVEVITTGFSMLILACQVWSLACKVTCDSLIIRIWQNGVPITFPIIQEPLVIINYV